MTMEDVETWLEKKEDDPGYQMLSAEESADAVRAGDKEDNTKSSDEDELPVKIPRVKLSVVRESLDTILTYIDSTSSPQIQDYYEHLRTLRELIIREQHNAWEQLKMDSSVKPVTGSPPASQPSQTKGHPCSSDSERQLF
ncbi:uncharacterized protein LOC121868385 [Homarus americanus]|uniref:Putative DDE superfamily endonuclease domain-containing protein 75 n=1 Tax=Homarus americanus TaxID=6706 RepID=A0A8J5MXT4_HOMAM|nr:uncharacterized protein LOC121868385 [Homarus americanus]KAG7167541.1 putative DDE superfamily endonuclease domain-containing protein 75 [Homarus americanus]